MRNLSQFKARLKVGVKLDTTHATLGSFGVREISIVQSNMFALKTTQFDGKITDSWCTYPSAKNFEIVDENTANIYWGEGDKREVILTYKFV